MRRGTLMRNYAHIFAIMMRLRQLCCHRELLPVDWTSVDVAELMPLVRKDMNAAAPGGGDDDGQYFST